MVKVEIQAQQKQRDERTTPRGREDGRPKLAKRSRHTIARVQAHAREGSVGDHSGDGPGTLGGGHPAWLCPIPDRVYENALFKPAGNPRHGAGASLRRAVPPVLRPLLDDPLSRVCADPLRSRCHHCLAQVS
jgi:hypothetical protein